MMRLNKFIAHYSTYSRREADKVVQEGYVRVNGEIQENPATQVDEKAEAELEWVKKVVVSIRTIRSEINIAPGKKIPVLLNQSRL